jgi:hypothetical protein
MCQRAAEKQEENKDHIVAPNRIRFKEVRVRILPDMVIEEI